MHFAGRNFGDFTGENKFSWLLGKFLSGISRSALIRTEIVTRDFIFSLHFVNIL